MIKLPNFSPETIREIHKFSTALEDVRAELKRVPAIAAIINPQVKAYFAQNRSIRRTPVAEAEVLLYFCKQLALQLSPEVETRRSAGQGIGPARSDVCP